MKTDEARNKPENDDEIDKNSTKNIIRQVEENSKEDANSNKGGRTKEEIIRNKKAHIQILKSLLLIKYTSKLNKASNPNK